jgi:hypothetical protein
VIFSDKVLSDLNISELETRSCLREAFYGRQESMLGRLVRLVGEQSKGTPPPPAAPVGEQPDPAAAAAEAAVPKVKTLRAKLAEVDKKYQSAMNFVRYGYRLKLYSTFLLFFIFFLSLIELKILVPARPYFE